MKKNIFTKLTVVVAILGLSVAAISLPKCDSCIQEPQAAVCNQTVNVEAGGIGHVFKKAGRCVEKAVSEAADKGSKAIGVTVGVAVGVAAGAAIVGAAL